MKNYNDELIEHLLNYDVVHEAEKTTKQKYETSSLTQRLAACNFVVRSRKLSKELRANMDTYKGMRFLDFINVVMYQGFKPVYNESFRGSPSAGREGTEAFLVYYHMTKGIALAVESFGGQLVNRAVMYYNWVPNQADGDWQRASGSGKMDATGLVWAGNCEVTEALKYKLELMERKGFFAQQWIHRPYIAMWNYMEGRLVKDLDRINQTKLSVLPADVRKAMLI
jgi:hypothetical protein